MKGNIVKIKNVISAGISTREKIMRSLITILRSKKTLNISLAFVKCWYHAWIYIVVVGMAAMIFYGFHSSNWTNLGKYLLISFLFLIEIVLYFRVAALLINILSKNKHEDLTSLGVNLFSLFFLDIISLLSGKFQGQSLRTFKQLLEVIPKDSIAYEVYSQIYLYIPSVFYFIKPHLEGTSLFITSVIVVSLSAKNKSE